MAANRGIFSNEKVSKLLSGKNGKPVLKPNRALVLKDVVANRKPKKGEATCVTEMSVLMACWKQNDFVDGLCSNEISNFYTCVNKAAAQMKSEKNKTQVGGGGLTPKQATTLLKRYPNLTKEI
ncbi:coiled-coil-helix-coiled-coil-helix domain-containing protein 1 [Mugil cephalus]|uniref:coiled-coil-helix-coiled-coil-helix domain-containing protein 1 n=1 Tax=Mugil cephalus TaxID=48193 RepID=UPI001FB76488|nr:coiled-coil-helix-coiled-coil-helix domain-containing protein 1 [Mugil cephalus]